MLDWRCHRAWSEINGRWAEPLEQALFGKCRTGVFGFGASKREKRQGRKNCYAEAPSAQIQSLTTDSTCQRPSRQPTFTTAQFSFRYAAVTLRHLRDRNHITGLILIRSRIAKSIAMASEQAKTKKFQGGERQITPASQRAQKYYPAEDEVVSKKVRRHAVRIELGWCRVVGHSSGESTYQCSHDDKRWKDHGKRNGRPTSSCKIRVRYYTYR